MLETGTISNPADSDVCKLAKPKHTMKITSINGAATLRQMHEKAIRMRKSLYEKYAADNFKGTEEEYIERDKELERQISIFGQVHNPRISAKSYRALNHTI